MCGGDGQCALRTQCPEIKRARALAASISSLQTQMACRCSDTFNVQRSDWANQCEAQQERLSSVVNLDNHGLVGQLTSAYPVDASLLSCTVIFGAPSERQICDYISKVAACWACFP